MKPLIRLLGVFALCCAASTSSIAGQSTFYAVVEKDSTLELVSAKDVAALYRNGYGWGSVIKLNPVHQLQGTAERVTFSQAVLKWRSVAEEEVTFKLKVLSHQQVGANCFGYSLDALFDEVREGSIGYLGEGQLDKLPVDLKAIPIVD